MSQRDLVLRMLRESGPKGVSAHVFNYEHGITRSAAIVHELRGQGYDIETLDEGKLPDGRSRMARYVLHDARSRGITGAVLANARLRGPLPQHAGDQTDFRTHPVVAVGGSIERLRPLPFPCGCVRSADGSIWANRCERHLAEA